MEEKKNNKVLVWVIVILIVLVLGLVGYIVYDKILFTNKDLTDENSTSTTTTHKVNDNINETNILRRDNFVYNLNNKNYHISYIYKKMDNTEFKLWKENSKDRDIKNCAEVYNMVYLEILLNEEKLDIEKIPLVYNYENLNNNDILETIHLLTSDTINNLKGKNSEYLVFTIEHANPYADGGVNPFIVSEEGNIIHAIKFQDNTGWWTTDENSIMYDKGEYYLTNDTLYYLLPNCEQTNGNGLYFDQYSLKVENDKAVIEKQGTYVGTGAGGAICQD